MMHKLLRSFEFIAWDNFRSLEFYQHWAGSLIVILAIIFFFQLISCIIVRPGSFQFRSATEEFVVRFAVGISLSCLILCLLSLVRQVTLLNVSVLGLVGLTSLFFISKPAFKIQLSVFIGCIAEYKFFWLLFLLSSINSLLPPFRFDETSYHLPYVLEFYNSRGVITDPCMRYPCYTFNWHILQLISQFFHPYWIAHLLNWSIGCICSLSIVEFSKRLLVNKNIACIAGLAFFLSPLVQRYLNVMY